MGDTGLLISHSSDENSIASNELHRQSFDGKLSISEGMPYGNVIAQMPVSNGHGLFFYNHYGFEKKGNDIKIDFIVSNNDKFKYKTYPIEVKSSKNHTATSLEESNEKYKSRIGVSYVTNPRNLAISDDVIKIPPCMAICLWHRRALPRSHRAFTIVGFHRMPREESHSYRSGLPNRHRLCQGNDEELILRN